MHDKLSHDIHEIALSQRQSQTQINLLRGW